MLYRRLHCGRTARVLLMFLIGNASDPRGGILNGSSDVWVGRCGWGAQTLTLFKTEIFDFPTLFKTTSRFLRPRLNTFNQNSLSSFVVAQA